MPFLHDRPYSAPELDCSIACDSSELEQLPQGAPLSSSSADIFHEFVLDSSPPPTQCRAIGLGISGLNSTQETAVELSLTDEPPLPPACNDKFVWSEPAVTNWEPDSFAVDAIFENVRRPRSAGGGPLRLQLTENWLGQAELSMQHYGPPLGQPSNFPATLDAFSEKAWCLEPLVSDGFVATTPPPRPSSPEILAQELKRKAPLLLLEAKRQCRIAPTQSMSPLDSDTLLANSTLDFSDSSPPPDPSAAIADDLRTSPSAPETGASRQCGCGPAEPNKAAKSRETQRASSLKQARARKLNSAEIDSIVAEASVRSQIGILKLPPMRRELEPFCSRVQMLEAMSRNRILKESARGSSKLSCSRVCSETFSNPFDLAKHLDESHDEDLRPIKCPYMHCEWSVIGFTSSSQCIRHIWQRHTVASLQCDICKSLGVSHYEFKRGDALRRHLNMIHGQPE